MKNQKKSTKPAKKSMTAKFADAILGASVKRAKKAAGVETPTKEETPIAETPTSVETPTESTKEISEDASIVVDAAEDAQVGSTPSGTPSIPMAPNVSDTSSQQETHMTLTFKSISKNGKEVTLSGALHSVKVNVADFEGDYKTVSFSIPDGVLKPEVVKAPKAPKAPKVQLTAEEKAAQAAERKAARAAKPKPTLAELAARARERAAKLEAKAAAEATASTASM